MGKFEGSLVVCTGGYFELRWVNEGLWGVLATWVGQ